MLRQVPPVEIAARVRLGALKMLSRNWRPPLPRAVEPVPIFTPLKDPQALYRSLDAAGLLSGCIEEADAVLDGRFTLFACLEHRVDAMPPDWLAAWPEGQRWSDGCSFDIAIGETEGRDVRFTWELSRHGDLVALARAQFLTGDVRYSQSLDLLLLDWMDKNPFLCGPNWISPLEAAMRAIAWCFIDEAAPIRQEASRRSFLDMLIRHGLFIERFNSFSLNPSNHLIGEAAALFVLGRKLPDLAMGRRWRARARGVLEAEIVRQTYPDGASREHSVGYHRYVTALFSLCLCVCGEDEFSEGFRRRLLSMYEFLARLMRPDSSLPDIGDRDDAVALRLSAPSSRTLLDELCLGAALFPDSDLASAASQDASAEALWLTGSPGAIEARQRRSCDAGMGLVLMRGAAGTLAAEFDRGAHGYDVVASHGHADALAVTLWKDCERLVDAGTFRYNGTAEWRDAFRLTAFHNTVTVDGMPQARTAAPFRWLTLADAKATGELFSDGLDWAVGTLEPGEDRPWRHTRELLRAGESTFIILDHIEAAGDHMAQAHWHFGRGEVSIGGTSASVTCGETGVVSHLAACAEVDVEFAVEEGWHSPSYGIREPSASLLAVAEFQGEVLLPWVLTLEKSARTSRIEPDTGSATAVEIFCGGDMYLFLCRPDAGLVHIGDVRFAGRWALLEMKEGKIAAAWGADAWALEEGDRRLFTAFGGTKAARLYPRDPE